MTTDDKQSGPGFDLDRTLVWFDTETTGTNTSEDRIVQLAVVAWYPDGTEKRFVQLFNPGCPIPAGASEVHGITDDDVKDAKPFSAMAKGLYGAFDKADWAGYNIIGFDVPILVEEFARCCFQLNPHGRRVVDLMPIFHKREPRDLAGALRYFCGEEIENAHDAMGDVQATIKVCGGMLGKYDDLDGLDGLAADSRDPAALDLAGKFIVDDDGKPLLNFGKHKGDVAYSQKGFLQWMFKGDFPADTKAYARAFWEGKGPADVDLTA